MQLAPYLFFTGGTCAAALELYKGVFGGSYEMTRIGDTPAAKDCPPETHGNVMHATFNAPGMTFMASDGRDASYASGNVSLAVASSDVEAGTKMFAALAEGGNVATPLAKQFWGAHFGQLTDRYGIDWMFNLG